MKASLWVLCILLFLATTLNYLDRQTVSILAPWIQRELGLDNQALGLLFSVFYYTYTVAQFGIGYLLDRGNLRLLYGGAVVAWSAAAALTGTASGFASLLGWRMVLGIVEAANWPAALRIVRRALPEASRPIGNGLFTSGTSIGALIAPVVILGIAERTSWRFSFVAVGALGLVWFALWHFWSRRAEFNDVWQATPDPTQSGWNAYRNIFGLARFWQVLAIACLVNPVLYFFVNWLPTYLSQQRGMSAAAMKAPLTYVFLGLDAGYLSSGALVYLLTKRGMQVRHSRLAAMTLATALVAACPFIASSAEPLPLLIAANIGVGIWISLYLTLAQEVSPVNTSTAAGLLGGSGSLAGAIAMYGVGVITKQTGSFEIPFQAASVAAALALLMAFRAR
jgi:MFS transporter, ACS family, hexuronate transporter